MAEDATIPDINEFLAERRANILNKLLEGVTTGGDLTDFAALRETLATIPAFDDEGDHRWWWEDNIDTDLRTEPEDLEEEDIAHIRTVLDTLLTTEGTATEPSEIGAHLYLLSLDRNFTLPEGKTALEVLEENPVMALKGDLRWLASPGANGAASVFGREFPAYNIDPEKLADPTSPEFIETFGAVLTAIQTDMRNIGITPPTGNDAFIDPAAMANPEGQTYGNVVEAIINRLGDNEELTAIKALTGAERLEALTTYVQNLPDSDANKAAITEDLGILSNTAEPLKFAELALEYDVINDTDMLKARLFNIHNIGADKTGMFGENTQALLEAYLDYAHGSREFQAQLPALRNRADYFARVYETYLDLPEDQRAAIDAALEARAGEAPGIQRPQSPEEREEEQRRTAEREALRDQTDVITAAAEAMNLPAAIAQQINPTLITGVPFAHLDEGYQREMREIFSESWLDTYGIKKPTADDPSDRIGGDQNLWRYRYPEASAAPFINEFFAIHADKPVIQQILGQTEDPFERYELLTDLVENLDENDPIVRGYAALSRDVNSNSFEYHIHPETGEITKYRVGANGIDLYTNIAPGDDTAIALDGQFPDFDIFHPNFITRDLLESLSERMWEQRKEEHGLSRIFSRQPGVKDLDQGIQAIERATKSAIQSLHADLDEEGINELYSELTSAVADPAQYYRAKLARENPDLAEEELDSRVEATMASYDKMEMMREILRARTGSESTVQQINTFLLQIQSMQELKDITALRDYTNYVVDGVLPNGSRVNPPRMESPWGNSPDLFDTSSFRWERATEFRVLNAELYAAYNEALHSNQPMSASLFDHDDYAKAYIDAQGWGDQLDYIQASMVTRAMMIKEAADRHGVDPNSQEAKAAFIQDYQDGYYNKDDINILLRSFDADGVNRMAHRDRLESAAWRSGSFDEPADMAHRMQLFGEMFKQPVTLPGTTLVAQTTIEVEDAMMLFWRGGLARNSFNDPSTGEPYDDAYYGLDFETMMERHANDRIMYHGEMRTFPEVIKHIMDNTNYYQLNLLNDEGNPSGDFTSREVRRYLATLEERRELQYKQDNNVVAQTPEVNADATPTLDPVRDTITPMPEPTALAERERLEELAENSDDMTAVPPSVAAITGGGVTPIPTPAAHPDLQGP